MALLHQALDYARQHEDAALSDLIGCLKIPSVSAQPQHSHDVAMCAAQLKNALRDLGFTAEVIPTAGHPSVVGEWLHAPGQPTVLIYAHYDVQPAEPLDEWLSPPFDPTVRDGKLFGRGAIDDKGQLYIHLKAIEAYLKGAGALPVNVKVLFEGEEEIGSPHLHEVLASQRERLAADVVVVSDTPMLERGKPAICYGLRGLCYLEVELTGPATDVHSGQFGGAVINPATVLVEFLTQLKDAQGRVTIPHFYDDVQPLTTEERATLAKLPFDQRAFLQAAGVTAERGEADYTFLERIWARPTLDVNGLTSGYQGEGAKTIIPAKASAKLSMRLVPNQDPEQIASLTEAHLKQLCPSGVTLAVRRHGGGKPFLTPLTHPAMRAAERALRQGFDSEVYFIREGGSIPFVTAVTEALHAPCLLVGFGLPDEHAHAPNEYLDLDNFRRGITSVIHLYHELSKLSTKPSDGFSSGR